MVVEASKLTLPLSALSSPQIASLLCEPQSLSLALMHSDSSFSLYPSLSPLSLPPPPPPLPTFIPPPSSAASFLVLRTQNPCSAANPRILFVVAGPHEGGTNLLLRFWILRRKSRAFSKARVLCTQSDLRFRDGLGVVMGVRHGISVKISGSVNYFAMYSASNSKIWVFGMKTDEDNGDEDGDGVVFKLIKCAVIECSKPVWSISISFGFLILGEEHGVRVLPLQRLLKGRSRRLGRGNKRFEGSVDNMKKVQQLNMPNGVMQLSGLGVKPKSKSADCIADKIVCEESKAEISSNGYLDRKKLKAFKSTAKARSLKLAQDLGQEGTHFVEFKAKEVVCSCNVAIPISERAITIQALSSNKFLVLDSIGDLHLLCLSNFTLESEMTFRMRQLTSIMKVRKLAVLPDSSTGMQTVWVSDELYSVHMMTLSDMETSVNGNDRIDSEEEPMQTSVVKALFTSGRIQDIASLAADALLVLAQGEIFVYAMS